MSEQPKQVADLPKKEILLLLEKAHGDMKAFVNQCNREGIGMQTVTDHRKRVDKFLIELNKLGWD